MPGFGESILGVIVLLAVLYGTRVFFLWYFRINKVIELLTSINQKLGAENTEPKVPLKTTDPSFPFDDDVFLSGKPMTDKQFVDFVRPGRSGDVPPAPEGGDAKATS